MGYAPPVETTNFSETYVHNKGEIAPGHAWIVGEKQGRDTLTFLREASVAELRDVFGAVAGLGAEPGEPKFILFHAVNPGDPVQHTNSKLPKLHIHAFTGNFADEFDHIANPGVKSYVVQPNADLAATIALHAGLGNEFQIVALNKQNGGEVQSHDILLNRDFESFDDFVLGARESEWETFRGQLVDLIEPTVEEGAGGCRIIIDDRYTNTGCFAVQVLSGENLDRSGRNQQRYFEAPLAPAND